MGSNTIVSFWDYLFSGAHSRVAGRVPERLFSVRIPDPILPFGYTGIYLYIYISIFQHICIYIYNLHIYIYIYIEVKSQFLGGWPSISCFNFYKISANWADHEIHPAYLDGAMQVNEISYPGNVNLLLCFAILASTWLSHILYYILLFFTKTQRLTNNSQQQKHAWASKQNTHTFQEKTICTMLPPALSVSTVSVWGSKKTPPYPFNASPVERPCPKIWPHLSIVRCHWRTPPGNILFGMHFQTCLCQNLH